MYPSLKEKAEKGISSLEILHILDIQKYINMVLERIDDKHIQSRLLNKTEPQHQKPLKQ